MFDITKLKKTLFQLPIIKTAFQIHSFEHKFSTKILTIITLKLGTQIMNIASIPSGEGEQLPVILCLKHGLP
jgi:hypothetical protein